MTSPNKELLIEVGPVPTYTILSAKSKKKIYYTWNGIYSSPHHSVRKKIVDDMKTFLYPFVKYMQLLSTPIKVHIDYFSSKKTFDIDNKGIWSKVLLDSLKHVGAIPDDNVKFVSGSSLQYHYTSSKEDSINITITQS